MKQKFLFSDLKAGLVVFLVALPLCLGIALAQGVPMISGIIAGVVGGIVVASISGSKLSVSGPAAGLTSIVITSIAQLGSFDAFLLAVCFAGIFQIILGILKAGIIGYYFPTAVIKGMLSAIGIILILKQIPHFFGYDKDVEGDETFIQTDGENTFSEFSHMIDFVSFGSLIIGIVSIIILIFWQTKFIKQNKILKQIPSALLVVIVAILIDLIFNKLVPGFEVKNEHLVILPSFDSFQNFIGSFAHPDFSAIKNQKVYEVAFVICAVASLETLLSLEAVDKLDPNHGISPTNRELVAQGFGNLVCGLIGGIPITSVIVRSSVNVDSGGKTQLSSIVHGLLFFVAIFILPNFLQMIPLSALAAILIVTGYNLSKPMLYKNIFKQGIDQFLPFIITIVVMLFTDLLKGVTVGIFVAIIFILKQNYKMPFKLIKDEIDGKLHFFIKLSQNVTFINKGKFVELFKSIPPNSVLFIDGGRATFIDKDVLEMISIYKKASKIHNIEVNLEEIPEVEILTNH
jgi:MFS superfamily sulfate permease-like transporter